MNDLILCLWFEWFDFVSHVVVSFLSFCFGCLFSVVVGVGVFFWGGGGGGGGGGGDVAGF